MSCPYIIRENIGFGRVREHGYYQFDEMVYDLTHDFVNADVEVFAHTLYNVTMESGEELYQLDDDTVFKMLSAGLPIRYVENARDGYITYSRPESKPVAKVKKVGGITRASASRGVKQYDEPVVLPMAKEWLIVTRADIPTCPFRTDNEQYATKRFERSVSSKWYDKPFYDEVRLYHNGAVVRAAVLGYEIIL